MIICTLADDFLTDF